MEIITGLLSCGERDGTRRTAWTQIILTERRWNGDGTETWRIVWIGPKPRPSGDVIAIWFGNRPVGLLEHGCLRRQVKKLGLRAGAAVFSLLRTGGKWLLFEWGRFLTRSQICLTHWRRISCNKFLKISSRAFVTKATILIWSKEMRWRSEFFWRPQQKLRTLINYIEFIFIYVSNLEFFEHGKFFF